MTLGLFHHLAASSRTKSCGGKDRLTHPLKDAKAHQGRPGFPSGICQQGRASPASDSTYFLKLRTWEAATQVGAPERRIVPRPWLPLPAPSPRPLPPHQVPQGWLARDTREGRGQECMHEGRPHQQQAAAGHPDCLCAPLHPACSVKARWGTPHGPPHTDSTHPRTHTHTGTLTASAAPARLGPRLFLPAREP